MVQVKSARARSKSAKPSLKERIVLKAKAGVRLFKVHHAFRARLNAVDKVLMEALDKKITDPNLPENQLRGMFETARFTLNQARLKLEKSQFHQSRALRERYQKSLGMFGFVFGIAHKVVLGGIISGVIPRPANLRMIGRISDSRRRRQFAQDVIKNRARR